jgi:uncharacterized protein (DUF1810 family)
MYFQMVNSSVPAHPNDPFDLGRFVSAQNPVYAQVCAELRRGRKQSHWMWFIFPQIEGLGHSTMARRYAISSRAEAEAYLCHPVLGLRLNECCRLVNSIEGFSIGEILGYPDDLKFHSSMTLFANADPQNDCFQAALDKYFGGQRDRGTLARL